jgi:hypothetical protein
MCSNAQSNCAGHFAVHAINQSFLIADGWRWNIGLVIIRFDRDSISFTEPAAQIDQFTSFAAEGKDRVWGDGIVDVGDRFFADGAEHGVASGQNLFLPLCAFGG